MQRGIEYRNKFPLQGEKTMHILQVSKELHFPAGSEVAHTVLEWYQHFRILTMQEKVLEMAVELVLQNQSIRSKFVA